MNPLSLQKSKSYNIPNNSRTQKKKNIKKIDEYDECQNLGHLQLLHQSSNIAQLDEEVEYGGLHEQDLPCECECMM